MIVWYIINGIVLLDKKKNKYKFIIDMTIYDDDYLHVNNCDGNVYYLIFT